MNNLDLEGIAFDHEEDHDQNNQPSTSTTFQNLKNVNVIYSTESLNKFSYTVLPLQPKKILEESMMKRQSQKN